MAKWLGPGKQTFYIVNDDGQLVPDVGGFLYHYEPGGDTPKDTWLDPEEAALNQNPVVLDQAGQGQIFGSGLYRQVYINSLGDTVWDTLTGEDDTAAVISADEYMDLPFEFLGGTPPDADEVVALAVFDRAVQIPADFDGTADGWKQAWGGQVTDPTATNVISFYRGTVGEVGTTLIGTATALATGDAWTWATTDHLPQPFEAGDYIKGVAPGVSDATWANLMFTIFLNVLADA